MVYRGRSVVTSGYSVRNRAASVPGIYIDEGYGCEPVVHSTRVLTSHAPRVRHEHIDLSSARQPDSKFYNDVNARLAALGPEPLLTSSYHAPSYLSPTPVLSNITPHHTVSVHQTPHVSVRRRTTSTVPVVHKRNNFDAEVAAYLSYTPQHHFSHRSSSLRSRSVPPAPIAQPLFSQPFVPLTHTPSTHFSRFSLSTPTYLAQFQHTPITPIISSELDYQPKKHFSYQPPIRHHYSPFVDPYESFFFLPQPEEDYTSDYVTHSVAPKITTESIVSVKEVPQRSRSRFSRSSAIDSYCSSLPRSSSIESAHRRLNFGDVKPPMSDTRRRVREVICKTRHDPTYYN